LRVEGLGLNPKAAREQLAKVQENKIPLIVPGFLFLIYFLRRCMCLCFYVCISCFVYVCTCFCNCVRGRGRGRGRGIKIECFRRIIWSNHFDAPTFCAGISEFRAPARPRMKTQANDQIERMSSMHRMKAQSNETIISDQRSRLAQCEVTQPRCSSNFLLGV